MRLMLHIIGADVRRFGWLIAAWLVVIAASFTWQGISPFLYEWQGVGAPMRATEGLLLIAQALVGTTLMVFIVQTHALVGSTAFWMTRPIPPSVLLRAKLLLIGTLLLAAPAIAEAVLMATYRVPAAQIARVLADSTLVRAMLMLAVVALVGLTRTFARFTILCGAIVVAVVLLINIVIFVEVWRATPVASFTVARPMVLGLLFTPRDATPDVVGTLAFIAGALWVIRAEYWRRPRRRVVGLLVAVPLLALAVWVVWPWQLLRAAPALPAWTEGLELKAPSIARSVVRQPGEEGAARRLIWIDLSAGGIPNGWLAAARLLNATLTTGQRQIESSAAYPALLAEDSHAGLPDRAVFARLLDAEVVNWTFGISGNEGVIALSIADDALPPHSMAGRYRGEFDIDLMHAQLVARLPLERGAVFQDGAYRLVIDDVDLRDALLVRVRISQAFSSFDGGPPPVYMPFLRHAKSRSALGADSYTVGQFDAFTASLFEWHLYVPSVVGFRPRADRIIFRGLTAGAPDALDAPLEPVAVETSDWRDAELVLIRIEHGGTLRRTIEVDQLVLPEPVTYRLRGWISQVPRNGQ